MSLSCDGRINFRDSGSHFDKLNGANERINPKLSTKTKCYEFTPQIFSAAFCYITLAQRCFYPFALFSYSRFKGGAAHVERSITFSVFHAWHNRRRNAELRSLGHTQPYEPNSVLFNGLSTLLL